VPHDQADPTDAFGLLQRCIPRRIGKNEGPKARVLVRSLRCWLFVALISCAAAACMLLQQQLPHHKQPACLTLFSQC
jgi:hypothetical protein